MTKNTFKWWWAWKSEKIELWLEQQAAEGWILEGCSLTGMVFHFHKGKPARIRFSIDYMHKLDPEYTRILEDDGWRTITMGAGWYVCAKEYEDRRPELYTDTRAMLDRNNRLLGVLAATGIPVIVLMPTVLGRFESEPFQIILSILWISLVLLYLFAMGRLLGTNRALKKKLGLSE